MDINSLISNYVEKNGGDVTSIKKTVENLAYDIKDCYSIFEYGDEATQEEFMDFISEAAGRSDDSFKKDVDLLFDILDSDGNGELSNDELQEFTRRSGSNAGEVQGWSLYNNLIKVKTDKSSSASTNASSGNTDSTSNVTSSDTGSSVSSTDTDTSVSSTATDSTSSSTTTDENVSESTSSSSSSTTNYDFSDPSSAKNFLNNFIDEDHKTYEEAISYLLEIGGISQEDAESIRTALTQGSLSSKDQAKVDALLAANPDMTEAEAIEKLGLKSSDDNSVLNEAAYKEINAEEYADQLYKAMDGLGTDEAALKSIINDDQISDADFVKIVEAYEQKYGKNGQGLITRIEQDTSGSLQTELTSKIGQRLIKAAENGDEKAIDVICKEIYSGTAAQMNTANDFLDAIFATENEDVLYNINDRYSKVNSGHDLITDIKKDHGGILKWRNWFGWKADASGNGQNYIDKINSAVRHHM